MSSNSWCTYKKAEPVQNCYIHELNGKCTQCHFPYRLSTDKKSCLCLGKSCTPAPKPGQQAQTPGFIQYRDQDVLGHSRILGSKSSKDSKGSEGSKAKVVPCVKKDGYIMLGGVKIYAENLICCTPTSPTSTPSPTV